MVTFLVIGAVVLLLLKKPAAGAEPTPPPTNGANPGQEVLTAVLTGLEAGAAWLGQQVQNANEANQQANADPTSFNSTLNNLFGVANATGKAWRPPVNTGGDAAVAATNQVYINTIRSG